MDDETIKEFNSKLTMFETSINGISSNLEGKLQDLAEKTKVIADNTAFLKRMKSIYDEQNKKLVLMEATLDELTYRLDAITNGTTVDSDKKKKKKKK